MTSADNHPLRILAIDPGTRTIGVAVFEDDDLTYHAVKTIKDRSTAQKIIRQATELVEGLTERYHPTVLAIEKMFIVQKSAALLSVVADEMKQAATARGLQVYEYYPSALRKVLCNSGKATKREVAFLVAGQYKVLARHLQTQSKWEEQYYSNMFDAVAVGLRCRMELTQQQLLF